MKLTQEEIHNFSVEYLKLKDLADNSIDDLDRFKDYQNLVMSKLAFLVRQKAAKYRKFSNYDDLVQEGFEGLMMALKSFNPNKSTFAWWANKYINTRISRAANNHSTIRFPIKKAKEIQPFKTNKFPMMIDEDSDSLAKFKNSEIKEKIKLVISTLSPIHQSIVNMTYGFNDIKESTSNIVIESLNISQKEYRRLLREAQKQIKQKVKGIND